MAIPKIIHYCWFGGKPLPSSAIKCIDSWKKFFPNYEIKEWNENNFDIDINLYVKEAYNAKKYAFVSDYARLWILYHYGGLYFDTDVEVIKSFDDIVDRGPFMGIENGAYITINGKDRVPSVAPGLGIGANANLSIYNIMMREYEKDRFLCDDGNYNLKTIVQRTTNILYEYGYRGSNTIEEVCNIWIYPSDFFCPYSQYTGKLSLTSNSRSIHHYDGTWLDGKGRMALFLRKKAGEKVFKRLCSLKRFLHSLLR